MTESAAKLEQTLSATLSTLRRDHKPSNRQNLSCCLSSWQRYQRKEDRFIGENPGTGNQVENLEVDPSPLRAHYENK